jgi:hypothetical protein
MADHNKDRMAWIRTLDALQAGGDRRFVEYEFASECRITGLLTYAGGAITCGPYTFEKDEHGLYHYRLRLAYRIDSDPDRAHEVTRQRIQEATEKGYFFKEGEVGELLSLFSLVLQCRFYLVAAVHVGWEVDVKHLYRFNYRRTPSAAHPKIFDERDRNFVRQLPSFLDRLRNSEGENHQRAILAVYHYARALREVGVDTEMVFIRLVSAVEALSQKFPLTKGKSPLDGIDFDGTFGPCTLTTQQKEELRRVLGVTKKGVVRIDKTQKRFIAFVEQYSRGALKGGNFRAKHLKITRKKMKETLDAIYRARSRYLHSGEPMYLSYVAATPNNWDTDPSLAMWADNRKFRGRDKLPYPYWFENIVRHCLLKYLEEM